jgi:hypothetical protein
MDQFNNLESWELLIESRQYRVMSDVKKLNLRHVADFAFLDLLNLFILQNEYETAPVAARYADKTMGFRNFAKARLSGTDLYTSLNILSDPTSVFSSKIAQNPEADAILRSKLKVHLPTVKRYLDLLADAKMTSQDAAVLLLRIEKQFNITDSKLKSIRRLVQDWPALDKMQRSLVVERMMQYYRKFAKRSELAVFLDDMGKSKGYEIRGPIDAELSNLGYGEKPSELAKAIGPLASSLAGFYAGYKLMRMFSPKEDK